MQGLLIDGADAYASPHPLKEMHTLTHHIHTCFNFGSTQLCQKLICCC